MLILLHYVKCFENGQQPTFEDNKCLELFGLPSHLSSRRYRFHSRFHCGRYGSIRSCSDHSSTCFMEENDIDCDSGVNYSRRLLPTSQCTCVGRPDVCCGLFHNAQPGPSVDAAPASVSDAPCRIRQGIHFSSLALTASHSFSNREVTERLIMVNPPVRLQVDDSLRYQRAMDHAMAIKTFDPYQDRATGVRR